MPGRHSEEEDPLSSRYRTGFLFVLFSRLVMTEKCRIRCSFMLTVRTGVYCTFQKLCTIKYSENSSVLKFSEVLYYQIQ